MVSFELSECPLLVEGERYFAGKSFFSIHLTIASNMTLHEEGRAKLPALTFSQWFISLNNQHRQVEKAKILKKKKNKGNNICVGQTCYQTTHFSSYLNEKNGKEKPTQSFALATG